MFNQRKVEKKRIKYMSEWNIQKERDCIEYAGMKYRYLKTITDKNEDNDFYHARSSNELIIDKSLVISKVRNLNSYISVFLGPSCGKKFNLSMLHYFFAKSVNGKETDHVFDGFAILQNTKYLQHHRKYSVIYLDFSDVKAICADELKVLLHQKIAKLYQDHAYLLKNEEINKYYNDYFNTIMDMSRFPPHFEIEDSFIRLAKFIRENNPDKGPFNRPILIINHYDDLISPHYQAQPDDRGIDLLRSFFRRLKDCSDFKFVIISGTSKKLKILSDNCSYYEAVPFFACTFTETLNFLKKHGITPTPNAFTELSIPNYPNHDSRFSERCYLPQHIIRFVKQQKMIQDNLPYPGVAASERLDTKKFAHVAEKNRQCDTIHNFFNHLNKPNDEINKRIRKIHQDSEITMGKRM